MATLTGSGITAGLMINSAATDWGTAGSLSTGDQAQATYSENTSSSPLTRSPVGTGRIMPSNSALGAKSYSFGLSGEATYQSGLDRILAQFFGTTAVSSELTASQGDYRHTFTFNSTYNTNYLTYAYETSTTTVKEFPSCAVTDLTLSASSADSYLQYDASLIADSIVTSSPTNNNAAIQATTVADDEAATVTPSDEFFINAQSGGAVSSSDQLNITDISINLTKPQSALNEIKDAAGLGEPASDGDITGTLTVTLGQLQDNTYFTAWEAETEYKAKFATYGSAIGTGENKSYSIYFPKLKLISYPSAPVSDGGRVPQTLEFAIFAAAANPTDMSDTTPYVELVNERTTAYLS